MRRREFTALIGASVAWPLAARAQQAGRTYRLGTLMGHPRDVPVNVAFLEQFPRYGFIEGKNLTVDWRAFGTDPNLLPQYAAELVSARVDVIATAGGEAALAAQQATKTIPIVALSDDLLGSGLVQSLARPEGNTTGVNFLAVDLDGKRQDILIEAVPGVRRMAVLADVNSTPAKLEAMQAAARAHSVELSIHRVARAEEIASAIDTAHASGATALNIFAGVFLWANRQLIFDRAATLRLPTMHFFPDEAKEGAFAAYGSSLTPLFVEIMPQQIIKLFRGAKVADVPVEQPTKFELVINLKTAKALGLTLRPSLLARADQVIE